MKQRIFALAMVVLVIGTAGCIGGLPGDIEISNETDMDTDTDQGSADGRNSSSALGELSSNMTTLDPEVAERMNVTVTRVIDGDTVEIEYTNGTEDTVRLLGVDTPETTLSRVSPDEYPGIENSTAGRDHLYEWGQRASTLATEELAGERVEIVVDAESDRRGYYGRLLAYVYVDGENFNQRLLVDGYARMYESQFSLDKEFTEIEQSAQTDLVGVWNVTGPSDSVQGIGLGAKRS